jgi:hypothetical protein
VTAGGNQLRGWRKITGAHENQAEGHIAIRPKPMLIFTPAPQNPSLCLLVPLLSSQRPPLAPSIASRPSQIPHMHPLELQGPPTSPTSTLYSFKVPPVNPHVPYTAKLLIIPSITSSSPCLPHFSPPILGSIRPVQTSGSCSLLTCAFTSMTSL